MWFTDSGANFFGSISPDGKTIHTYSTLQAGGHPRGIAAGPDGNLYICDPGNNEIYVESTSGTQVNRQPVPTTGAKPYEIVNGGDGYMYFTEFAASINAGSGQIGVITPHPYSVTEIATPNNTIGPFGIGLGPDGHVWFTEYGNNHVGELNGSGPTATITEFPSGTGAHGPSGLATGYDRMLWLAMDGASSSIERFNTVKDTTTSYTLPNTGEAAYEIITGPDGNLWYTTQADTIGRIELAMT
jgi:virginiamycin B lyase